ncbi:uncharacterized protein LOC131847753 [Achroia grisella]|uniref:uncharacterized protein LOC131847753 n=1 Tax=Achroia grisella TaxID=688607 RepID=UPI0027D2FBFB|nr:uncharacterized protein LOC131847753 [Achroia grisella]
MSSVLAPNCSILQVNPQTTNDSQKGSKTHSVQSIETGSSHSSATVKAQKAAAEAMALRRRLERELDFAAREREREEQQRVREEQQRVREKQQRDRELQLSALQEEVENSELRAELAAIEANGSCTGSRTSHHNSTRVVNDTERWVENTKFIKNQGDIGNRVISAIECEQQDFVPSAGCPVLPPTTTRPTASPVILSMRQHNNIISVPEAVDMTAPLVNTDTNIFKIVADTAAAAKALASSRGSNPDLFPFSGNPLQWLHFKRIYELTKNNFSTLGNLSRLQSVLRGPAHDAVAALLMATDNPDEVIRALEENFARPELIVFREVSQLKNLPRLGTDLKELATLANRSSEDKLFVSTTHTGVQQPTASRPRAFLKVIPITVSGPRGSCDVFALLDDGSTATLIDTSIATRIGATGPQHTITVNVKNAKAMDSLSLRSQTINREDIEPYSHLSDLVDVLSYDDVTPTVLIGAEDWHLSINRDVRVGKKNEPVACLTVLGWTLYGASSSKTKLIEFVNHGTFIEPFKDDDLESLIKEQYKIDSLGISKTESVLSMQEQRAVDILEATSRCLPSGRFEVGMPWRHNIHYVPDSYPQALSRFLSLERRMSHDTDFSKAYCDFITNMITKNYAEECASETYYSKGCSKILPENIRFYLPHFGIYHPQKRKLRVVHDAAAKNEGVSLNSLLLPGPDLLQSLLKILFCFREGQFAMMADIKEMFPQVRIREQDRDAFRFLWRYDKSQPIKEYRMTAVIFGACCSPFIAQFIKNKNASLHEHVYPKAAEAILGHHYMDDYVDSLDNINEAAQLASDIVTVHAAACFEMRGWISNEPMVLKLVPEELRAAQPLEIDLCSSVTNVRALGISWSPITDNLGFRTGIGETHPTSLTKRKVLSHIMRVYDPLGLLGPIVVKGRILFQKTWRTNIDWDTELSQSETSKWNDWFKELLNISSLTIPRWYSSSRGYEPSHRELHIFADASELAYACVAYWRLVYADGSIKLVLISSKARVSPLKPISIPRLELQAALMASRLAITIKDSHRKKTASTNFWTDSMTVLQWLRSDARCFKPFVAHRIGEMLENSSVSEWRWVPTDMNVADDATRLLPIDLNYSHRWFCGPPFLYNSPKTWPIEPVNITPIREELKCEPHELVGFTSFDTDMISPVTAHFNYFSDWIRLLRATARVHQAAAIFRKNLVKFRNSKLTGEVFQSRQHSTSTNLSPLGGELIKNAERHILMRTQLDSFGEEYRKILNSEPIPRNSRLCKLSPNIGEDKLLHLAGRIKAVEDVDPETKFPILLDGHHSVVRLLVLYYHRRAGHANHELVINDLRQRFWLISLRNTVRSVARQCPFCSIRRTLPMDPLRGDLPQQRLAHHQRPFTFTGIDYFGPITVTIGRRHEKRYVALFTCLSSRAIHLEVVHSLSADAAIMSLRRFIARRGAPTTIFSDNGTAFVGACRILKEFLTTDVKDFVATKGITWSFIPPAAPTFGGCWERLVRTVKVALKATLKERSPKEEVLLTLLAEAEAIVNSRPLSHVSSDPDDPTTLTPFHFLIGTSSNQINPVLEDRDLIGRSDWRKALRLSDHFWNRWVREVLPTMQPRAQTRGMQGQVLQIGDVVIIVDESLPRGTWPRGRVEKMFPGKDGVIRVVDVATSGGTLRRPLKKLVKLTT